MFSLTLPFDVTAASSSRTIQEAAENGGTREKSGLQMRIWLSPADITKKANGETD